MDALPLSLLQMPLVASKRQLLPYSFVKQHAVLPLAIQRSHLLLAIADLADLETVQHVALRLGKEVIEYPAPRELIEQAIAHCYTQHSAAQLMTAYAPTSPPLTPPTEDLLEGGDALSVATIWRAILAEAVQLRASDIHLDPLPQHCMIRYRIDGQFKKEQSCSSELAEKLRTRLKLRAQLDIAEKRLPQDGHLQLQMGQQTIDLRISTLPVVYGERIVLRLLDRRLLQQTLSALGMPADIHQRWQQQIAAHCGLFLVSGATGSGKTTTLYRTLLTLDAAQHNIMTVEDPVEYQLPGIAQTSIQHQLGLTFATALRHLLRQDPDVLLIGEIRDRATATIAIRAALTGRRVFATLHADDGAAALIRLRDLGVRSQLLVAAVRCILSQRLVPRSCSHCQRGCHHCLFSGFSGRTAIYALLEMDAALARAVRSAADSYQLRGRAGIRKAGEEQLATSSQTTPAARRQ